MKTHKFLSIAILMFAMMIINISCEQENAQISSIEALSQEKSIANEKETLTSEPKEIFTEVENQPAPYNGMTNFPTYIQQNLKYPSKAKEMGIEGPVYVQFVVAKDGTITDVKALKGIGGGCDQAAVRVIENSPKWKPGKQRGRAVNVRMVLPINFKLD